MRIASHGTQTKIVIQMGASVQRFPVMIFCVLGQCLFSSDPAEARPGTPSARKANKPMLGVHLGALTPKARRRARAPKHAGVLIVATIKGSPAEKAGLRAGDALMRVDRRYVYSVAAALGRIARRKPGDVVQVEVVRRGSWMTAHIQLADYLSEGSQPPHARRPAPATRPGTELSQAQLIERLAALTREVARLHKIVVRLKARCR